MGGCERWCAVMAATREKRGNEAAAVAAAGGCRARSNVGAGWDTG
jgi:hypothetical protein